MKKQVKQVKKTAAKKAPPRKRQKADSGKEPVKQPFLKHFLFGEEKADLTELESGSTTILDILSPTAVDTKSRDYIVVDGVFHAYLYVTGYGYSTTVGSCWLAPLVEAGEGVSISFSFQRQPKDKILSKIAQTTMVNRSRMRDVGFKTTPLVIWVVISLAKEAIPFLPVLVGIINLWLIYIVSVPAGHFVKQYQNGFMKFLFESPETFEFHDDLQVIEFEPDGTEEAVVKGRILERGKVSFKQAFHDYFHGMLSFGGRSTRAGFWKVALIIQVLMMIFWTGFLGYVIIRLYSYPAEEAALLTFMTALGVGMIIFSAFVPFGFANWAVMIRRLRDVGLKLKTMFIGWGLMAVLNIIILIVFGY